MRGKASALGLMGGLLLSTAASQAGAESFDLIVRGGTVLDGTGLPRQTADIGVRGGYIARVGDLSKDTAAATIDAKGLFVAPGFINIHSHPEPDAVAKAENMLTQGVTTEIANPDGRGSAHGRGTTDLASQAKEMAAGGLAANLGFYIGFNTVWEQVMGASDHRADAADIAKMQGLVTRALKVGAWGVSAGLDYKPGYFARQDEVERIISVAGPWRTNFPNHERLTPESGYSGMAGMRETIDIGVATGLSPVITHMKSQGAEQGRAQEILDMMAKATRSGHYAAGDIYPYLAGFNDVRTLTIPSWALDGGDDALYARFKDPALRARLVTDIEKIIALRFNGPGGVYVLTLRRQLTDLMKEWNVSAGEAIIRLNEQYRGHLPQTYLQFGIEDDLVRMMQNPAVAIACDCGSLATLTGHPRAFGTFPRVLGVYVREKHLLTWEDAIRKMSGLPASTIGLVDRGFLAPGMAADITVFDPATIIDKATYETPRLSEGVRYVVVNGRLALKDGQTTGAQGGGILWRSPNMPTRPFNLSVARHVTGAVQLAAPRGGARLKVDIQQDPADHAARGRVVVVDRRGAAIFTADNLGVLQMTRGWASVTGQGHARDGRATAFTLILDGAKPGSTMARAVSLTTASGLAMTARKVGATKLSFGG